MKNRSFTIAAIVCLIIVAPAFVFAGSLGQAKKFLEQKNYKLAVISTDSLTIKAPNGQDNAKAWMIRGDALMRLGNVQAGLNAYEKAALKDLGNNAEVLKEKIMEASNASPHQADAILSKAHKYFEAPFIAEVRNNLVANWIGIAEKRLPNNLEGAKLFFNKIMELEPAQRLAIYNQVLAVAKTKDDVACLPYYQYATNICRQNCPEAIEAGNRLYGISQKLFQNNPFDQKVEKYRVAASQFIKIAPLVRVYEPKGSDNPYIFPFTQAGMRMDHWIGSPEGMDMLDEIFSTNDNFKVYLRQSGKIIDYSKGQKIPKNAYEDDMLIESLGPVRVMLCREKTVI
jgi:tetratricopeptide (TPR) repeat protein